ncbi:MAG: DUF4373 domain-containing protein [Lentimicrobium sp.]|nr:DUF4373 domain-containing protein [Lentimicrobium sp.]
MGRIEKNNCDYFPHLVTMRNHRKVKALRNKFGQVLGYAFWSMVLEYLTEQDGNEFEYSEDEIEMFAAELSIEPEKAKAMIEYCLNRELLFLNSENFIYSNSLNAYLSPVYDKRMRARKASETRERRENGRFCHSNSNTPGISVTEKPQSKVKESKEKESKVDEIIPEKSEPEILIVDAEVIEELPASENRNIKPKGKKILFAESVLLSEEEYRSLVATNGEPGAKRIIEILDNYKGSSGKKYKSDYKAILSWVIDRYNKENYGNPKQYSSLAGKAQTADNLINSMFRKEGHNGADDC